MGKRGKQELVFIAEGETPDGKTHSYCVYKKGTSFYIDGPNFYRHLCHPSVKDHDAIRLEIFVVFGAKVMSTKFPWQLSAKPGESFERSQ